ncbi:hypothetical protein [Pseudochrobactrum sp. MP213Fo]|uniref:hypothetical protein n=1 Tax=Pseudochrobactrum sp. MP213Fo TaxID=3022250 RepID=UPI003B9DED37
MSENYENPRSSALIKTSALFIIVLIGLAVWSVSVWVIYNIGDSVLTWATTSGSAVLDAGKSLGGKEVTSVIDALNIGQLIGSAGAFLRVLLAPVLWIIWAGGALIIVFLPLLWRQIRPAIRARRYRSGRH